MGDSPVVLHIPLQDFPLWGIDGPAAFGIAVVVAEQPISISVAGVRCSGRRYVKGKGPVELIPDGVLHVPTVLPKKTDLYRMFIPDLGQAVGVFPGAGVVVEREAR